LYALLIQLNDNVDPNWALPPLILSSVNLIVYPVACSYFLFKLPEEGFPKWSWVKPQSSGVIKVHDIYIFGFRINSRTLAIISLSIILPTVIMMWVAVMLYTKELGDDTLDRGITGLIGITLLELMFLIITITQDLEDSSIVEVNKARIHHARSIMSAIVILIGLSIDIWCVVDNDEGMNTRDPLIILILAMVCSVILLVGIIMSKVIVICLFSFFTLIFSAVSIKMVNPYFGQWGRLGIMSDLVELLVIFLIVFFTIARNADKTIVGSGDIPYHPIAEVPNSARAGNPGYDSG